MAPAGQDLGNTLLEQLWQTQGHTVFNLGAKIKPHAWLDAVDKHQPDFLSISCMSEKKSVGSHEERIEVPYKQLEPETLQNLIQEFVTRDGNDWGDDDGALENKVSQVMQQLRNRKGKVVFDMKSETANIVICR